MAVRHIGRRDRIPGAPDLEGQVNFIIDFWANPCDAPLYIYVETLAPVALDALFAYFCFDILDLVRWIFRPAGLWPAAATGRGGGRRFGRRRKGLGARVRARLPILQRIRNRPVTNGVKTLWRIDEIGQRLLYWWMVADIAETGLYNWSSLMMKSDFCQQSASANRAAATDFDLELGSTIGEAIIWDTVDFSIGDAGIFGATIRLPPGPTHIIVGVNGTPKFPATADHQLVLAVLSGPDAGQHVIDSFADHPEWPDGMSARVEVQGGVDCFVEVHTASSNPLLNATSHVIVFSPVPIPPPDTLECDWSKYFNILPDGALEKVADLIIPQEALDWYDQLPDRYRSS